MKYCIAVQTGSEEGSSTDAEIYICLYGEKGDTGQRTLNKSNQQDKFKQSQVNILFIYAYGCREFCAYGKRISWVSDEFWLLRVRTPRY